MMGGTFLAQKQQTLSVDSMDQYIQLFGVGDENVRILEDETGAMIALRGDELSLTGEEEAVDLAAMVIGKLFLGMIARKEPIDRSRIRYAVELAREGNVEEIEEIMQDTIAVTYRGKRIKCRTLGQKRYVEMMRKNLLTFAVGPAGTGKTYLAMAMAVVALKKQSRWSGLSSRAPRWRRARSSASCPAISRRRLIRICARSTTRCMT